MLRCVYAAPTAFSVLPEFMQRFGVEAFVDAFGLTETCAPIMSPYGEMRPAGAQGLLAADWFEARLVDPETDQEVPVGSVGELVIRYKHPWTSSMGYYGMPEKTLEAWRNLWFHTGDALRRDADGWYYFVDRYKDTLRRRGENISSYEVEQVILGHPAVAECAVVGVPADFEAGEDEVLAVVVAPGDVDPARSGRGARAGCRASPSRGLSGSRTSCRGRRPRRSVRPNCGPRALPGPTTGTRGSRPARAAKRSGGAASVPGRCTGRSWVIAPSRRDHGSA